MLLADLGPILMFIAGIGLLTAILLRRTYRHIGRRRRTYDSRPIATQPRPTGKWDGACASASTAIERQKVELADLSRDVNGQLDTKILILRDLLVQSQQQIERIELLLGELERKEPQLQRD